MGVVFPIPHKFVEDFQPDCIIENGTATNEETTVYSVASGYTLWIQNLVLSLDNNSVAAHICEIRIYNTTPALVHTLKFILRQNEAKFISIALNPPIKLPESYSIRIYSDSADLDACLNIIGYLL